MESVVVDLRIILLTVPGGTKPPISLPSSSYACRSYCGGVKSIVV